MATHFDGERLEIEECARFPNKGLELDGVIVVEPAAIVADEMQGLRALYVALTRSTRRLSIVHSQPLPLAMVGDA